MRAKDFLIVESQNLFEVNMSPSNLKKLAGAIDAKVGFEFEMIVPGVGSTDGYDDREMEPDYDMDERTEDIDDIVRFFHDGEYNERSTIRELRSELEENYREWVAKEAEIKWDDVKLERTYEYVKDQVSDDEIAKKFDIDPDLFGKKQITDDMYKKFALDEVDDEGEYYERAKDAFIEEVQDDPSSFDLEDNEWVDQAGLRHMADVERRYNVSWPHWSSPDRDESEPDVESVAEELEDIVGRKVNASTDYHGGYRQPDEYDLEPDQSLSGSGREEDEAGLELISPPMSIEEMLDDVKKIKKWADEKGAYTNRSTGLHMNISVPDFNQDKLDFVKLTLLLGDQYLLDQFGRSANTYCKSAMDIIKEAPNEQDKELLFKKLKDNIETIASKTIHSGRVGKFTSINPKDNRVEFRGPGGDWLDQNFSKIEDTLYRCVVALDAACDPKKYREDYLKKLTKMFAPTKGSLEDVFVQYAAGTINRQELKFKLKATQSQRKQEKLSKEGVVELEFYDAQDGDYIIEYDNPAGHNRRIFLKRTEQVSDPNKAMEVAMKLEPSWFKPDDIENIIVTEFSGNKDYAVLDADGDLVSIYRALTPLQAIDIAMSYNDDLPKDQLTAKLASEYHPQEQSPERGPEQPAEEYKLYKVSESERPNIFNYVAARSVGEAKRMAMIIYPNMSNDVDIVLQDATRTTISAYTQSQQVVLDRMNDRSGSVQANIDEPQSALNNSNADMDSYIVSEPDGTGQVRMRANSTEHAIERARAAYNIPSDRELIATRDTE